MIVGGEAYLWIKSLHVIAVMSWIAGMLYLPRLFVYHVAAEKGGDRSETLKIMERKLLRFIMTPAMVVAVVTGGIMAPMWFGSGGNGWLHGKLVLVVLMIGFHHAMMAWRKAFERDENRHSERFFRMMNEGPTVLMIAIVILVVVKPF